MVALHDRVEAPLAELGYREEHRRYQPHLTLGRVRGAIGHCRARHAYRATGRHSSPVG